MSVRRILIAGLAVSLLAAGLVVPIAAQQQKWKELNNKVAFLMQQGKYAEALVVAQEALRVAETSFDRDDSAVATSRIYLAELYRAQNKYAAAEPLYKRSLSIVEKAFGSKSPRRGHNPQ